MRREEVWMRAFCAYVASFNARTESGIRAADECLAAFDERFPAMEFETLWCGTPISQLSNEERKEMRDHVTRL